MLPAGPRRPPPANLRVSDAERNEVADKLSRHFADGRLDPTEFKERLDAAMSAKTQGDLAGLFDDLPPSADEPPPPPSRRRRMVPFLVMVAFIAMVAGSTVSLWHAFRIPWLLVAVVAFFVWHRVGGITTDVTEALGNPQAGCHWSPDASE